jgi:hypothetical protein
MALRSGQLDARYQPADAFFQPWEPQPGPQSLAIAAPFVTELMYGGARGGGKSDYLLGDFLQDVDTYGENWRGIIFPRSYPELEELMARAKEIYLTARRDLARSRQNVRVPVRCNAQDASP